MSKNSVFLVEIRRSRKMVKEKAIMKSDVLYVKFNPKQEITKDDFLSFSQMKILVQQELLHLKINLNSGDYRKNPKWKLLEENCIFDTESQYIYSESWFAEQYLITPEKYIAVNSCYAMGTKRKLCSKELSINAMCKALSYHTVECYGMDTEAIKKGIIRTDKDGMIIRINKLFGFKMDDFSDEDQKYKLLFLCSRFEGKFGSKTLGELLRKPSFENIDNSRAGKSTVNGEMIAFLKHELEKELSSDFVWKVKNTMCTIAKGWERQIQSIREKLDNNIYTDNSEEINRVYNMLGNYAQFYNRKVCNQGKYKNGLLETVYIKLAEHESIGSECDIIQIFESMEDLEYGETDKKDFYKELAAIQIPIDKIDIFLEENYLKMVCWVFGKDKTTSNEKDKYKRAAKNLGYFIKMLQENTKYKNMDKVDALLLVIFIREYISLNSRDVIENKYYRAGDFAVKSIKSELYNDTYEPIRAKSQVMWVERVVYKYNMCFHSREIVAKVKKAEKYLDWLFVRNLETNSIEDLQYIYIHFMYEIQGLMYPQKEIEKKKKHLENILRKKAYKWTFQIPTGDSCSPARQFFSLTFSDNKLEAFAKTMKAAMSRALRNNTPEFHDYQVDIEKGYFKEKVSLSFELVANPQLKQISVNKTEIVDEKMEQILIENDIF